MKSILFVLAAIFLLSSCSNSKENLPASSGLSGDMYLVMDSTQWKGPLGDVLDSVFRAEMQGLPRTESIFRMHWIDPRKLNFILKQRRNLIFVVTLDQRHAGASVIKQIFTPASLEKIKTDSSQFVQTTSNLFARGQEVMYLYSNTEAQLIEKVRKNASRLVEFFNQKEREKLTKDLYKSGRLKGVSSWLNTNFQCDMQIPFGYKLVQSEPNFLWVRQINPKDDKDVFIAWGKYKTPNQFKKENLIAFRDSVCQQYLFEDPDITDSYLVTETSVPFVPIQTREINFNGLFAVEMRGIWRTNNKSMGGPFLSYALADESTGKFYYIEGFTFSPSREQREIMRELETILFTFKTSTQLTAKK
jgi:Domain of unknown function (DUF4837)